VKTFMASPVSESRRGGFGAPFGGLLPDAFFGFGLVALLVVALRVLPPGGGMPSPAAAGASAGHGTGCCLCRLPALGRPGEPSIYGPSPVDEDDGASTSGRPTPRADGRRGPRAGEEPPQ
jgi:hypothetical protein